MTSSSSGSGMSGSVSYDVYFEGRLIHLDTTDLINQGGEALVFRAKNLKGEDVALKIIHPSMRNGQRFKKLVAQIKRLPPVPDRTVGPQSPVNDDKNKEIVGFSMKLIDVDKYDQLIWWTRAEYRLTNKIDIMDVTSVFYEIAQEQEQAILNGYLYGDFNPKGILVLRKEFWDDTNKNDRIRIVDADACVFDDFKCEVYTLDYLDPRMGQDIKNKTYAYVPYDKGTDIFCFTAMLLQVLTTVGPWHGYHPTWGNNSKALMMRNLHILHPDVEYPTSAVQMDQLPPAFQDFIKGVLVDGKRDLMPLQDFEAILGIQGKTTYNLNIQRAAPVVSSVNAYYEDLLSNLGLIVDFVVSGEVVHILSIDPNGDYQYITYFNNTIKVYPIEGAKKGANYRILDANIVSEILKKPSKVSVAPFRTYHVTRKQWRDHASIVNIDRTPIVGGGNGNIVYGNNGYLMQQEYMNNAVIKFGHSVGRASSIVSDPASGNYAGYIKTYVNYEWFFCRKGLSYDIPISPLDDTENMVNFAVLWGENTAVLVRQTEYQGAIRTRLDEVNLTSTMIDNRIIGQARIIDGQLFRPINGAAYIRSNNTSFIFYATHDGIARENLQNGKIDVFEKTKGLVDKGLALRLFRNGIVAIGDGAVRFISL